MRRFLTWAFFAYFAVLTVGLVTPDPMGVARGRQSWLHDWYLAYLEPIGHLLGFTALGFLGAASRWPWSGTTRLIVLAFYAVGTEAWQMLVPPRTPEWKDVVQNLAGIGIGALLWWGVVRWRQRSAAQESVEACS